MPTSDPSPPHESSPALRVLRRIVDVRPGELRGMLISAVYYFALMASYYPLRAIRDEIGSRNGAEDLSDLFTGTLVAMMIAVPVFAWLISRFPRQRVLPWVYAFFTLNIVAFYVLFQFGEARLERLVWLGRNGNWWAGATYFVWVSVFNVFVVSVFWGYLADLFRSDQGKRLFGFIAAGASVGAIVGAAIPSALAETWHLHIMLLSAAVLQLAVVCIWLLGRLTRDPTAAVMLGARQGEKRDSDTVGGSWWEAFTTVTGSPYLLGIAAFVLLYTASSTLVYFIQAELIDATFDSRETRVAVFGRLDLATNILSLIGQAIIAGRLMSLGSVKLTLIILPIVSLLGFVALLLAPGGTTWFGYAPILVIFLPFQTIRRASNYALAKPAREVLFTVVTRSEKYKAKVFIDTAIYRAGDAATAWALKPLEEGAKLLALTGVGIPLAVVWAVLAFFLGREHRNRERAATGASDL